MIGKLKNKVLWRVSLTNIRIIKTGINVSKIVKQLEQYPEDCGGQKEIEGAQQIDPDFHRIEAGVLQLVMGGINHPSEMVYNTEICVKTPAYKRQHGAKNIGDITRITFVFDVPHHKSNP